MRKNKQVLLFRVLKKRVADGEIATGTTEPIGLPIASGFNTYLCLIKIALCVIMSMIAGTERATKLHSAGIKTFILVGLAGLLGAL